LRHLGLGSWSWPLGLLYTVADQARGFHPNSPYFELKRETLGAKTLRKWCHVGILEGIFFWATASRVKAQRTNYRSPPIKLLEFPLLLTFGHCVKWPLELHTIKSQNSLIIFWWILQSNNFTSQPTSGHGGI
jgi:hypothetical protein